MDLRNNILATGSKGLRNNNPGNFRPGVNWMGIVGVNDNFLVFSDTVYGVRAMALNLYNNYYVSDKKTLLAFIKKYAPASDGNDPDNYASLVAAQVGIDKNADMDLTRQRTADILRAMMNVELSPRYSAMVTDAELLQGVDMIGKFEIMALKTEGKLKRNIVPVVLLTSIAVSGYLYFITRKKKQ